MNSRSEILNIRNLLEGIMKSLSLTTVLVTSIIVGNTMVVSKAFAYDSQSYSNGQCEYSVDYNVKIDKQKISLTHPQKKSITFTSEGLVIDGKSIELTTAQKDSSNRLQVKTRDLIPKVADIAIEGAELGIKAATMVITALGGASQAEQKEMLEPLDKISKKIRENVNHKTFNNKTLSDSFDKEIEKDIERFVAKAIKKFSGRMIGQLMGAIFSGGDEKSEEMKDFEFRMENLEHDIETYVESNATALEAKAKVLCGDLEKMAKIDLVLESVDGYPENGIIHKGQGRNFHINRFSLSD
ncbi:MAG: hypothetical protein ACJAS9_002700 [Polaribacter sp.]|jgi:hypothetical protein